MKINTVVLLLICTLSTVACDAVAVFVDAELDAQRSPPLDIPEDERGGDG